MKKVSYKKLRLWLVYPFFVLYPLLARMTDVSFFWGAVLMIAGLAIRFWASGYLKKSRSLATSGPYAYTRNPLYLGNFILGLGVSVIANNIWLTLYYIATFSYAYIGTISDEEKLLYEKFGQAYNDYLKNVPAFFPSLKAYRASEKSPFELRQSFRNGEFIRVCGFSMLILFFYILHQLRSRESGVSIDSKIAVSLFVVFSLLLWFNISIRKRKEGEWTGGRDL